MAKNKSTPRENGPEKKGLSQQEFMRIVQQLLDISELSDSAIRDEIAKAGFMDDKRLPKWEMMETILRLMPKSNRLDRLRYKSKFWTWIQKEIWEELGRSGLLDNRQFITALLNRGRDDAFIHASHRLRGDLRMAIAAALINSKNLNYVSEELKGNPKFEAAVNKANEIRNKIRSQESYRSFMDKRI